MEGALLWLRGGGSFTESEVAYLEGSAGAEEHPSEVDINDRLPLLKLHAHQEPILGNSRVVYNNL